MDRMNLRPAPCDECPWTRTSVAGRLGGSPPETYIGQVVGPFQLPCHKACDFRDPEWKDKAFETLQCAGVAIMRTHLGIAAMMPDALPCLPPASEVFATLSEFVAHHKGISLAQALLELVGKPPSVHLKDQLTRPGNRTRRAGLSGD